MHLPFGCPNRRLPKCSSQILNETTRVQSLQLHEITQKQPNRIRCLSNSFYSVFSSQISQTGLKGAFQISWNIIFCSGEPSFISTYQITLMETSKIHNSKPGNNHNFQYKTLHSSRLGAVGATSYSCREGFKMAWLKCTQEWCPVNINPTSQPDLPSLGKLKEARSMCWCPDELLDQSYVGCAQ